MKSTMWLTNVLALLPLGSKGKPETLSASSRLAAANSSAAQRVQPLRREPAVRSKDSASPANPLSRWGVNPELRRLEGLASEFRRLILSAPVEALPDFLRAFPYSDAHCCSFLLSMFLREVGYGRIYLVSGIRDGERHVWLETLGLTVDITVDQFLEPDIPRCFATEGHPWYQCWTMTEIVDINFMQIDIQTHRRWLDAYESVVTQNFQRHHAAHPRIPKPPVVVRAALRESVDSTAL